MLVLLIIVAVVIVFTATLYNTVVSKKNQVENAFGSIDAMLKKRYDLIPNLVSTVQKYMEHEKGTLTEITELRAKAISGGLSSDETVDLDNRISKSLGGIMVAVENYPDLKANTNFLQLQGTLHETEEQLSAARRAYNAAVTAYNNIVEMFPTNIFASMMNCTRKNVFEAQEAERKNVDVKDLFNK